MRKIFALLMAGSLLAFAGAAFGADAGHVTPVDPGTDTEIIVTPPVQEEITKIVVTPDVVNAITEKITSLAQTIESLVAAVAEATEQLAKAEDTIKALSASVTVQEVSANTIEVVGTTTEAEAQERKEAATKRYADEGKVVAATMPTLKPKQSGVFLLPMPAFDRSYYGKPITWNPGKSSRAGVRAVTTADATTTDGATFLNSSGDVVTTVPGTGTAGIEPGVVTVAANLDANYDYEPAITIAASDVDDPIVKDATTEAVEATKTDGDVIWFSNQVPTEVLEVLEEKLGSRPNLLEKSGEISSKTVDVDLVKARGDNKMAWAPAAINPSAEGTYVLYMDFFHGVSLVSSDNKLELDLSSSYVKLSGVGEPEVAADSYSVYVENSTTGELESVENIPNFDGAMHQGYLVFKASAGEKAVLLTTGLKDTGTKGSSSSSGGCNAGVVGLGMIPVAFALMVLRRKSK